jgi:biopolymer transport protein ExbD
MKRHETQTLMAEINITPFTDVILVLLIIFMIATPLMSQSNIEIKLPEASSAEVMADTSKPVYITITSEGVVYFEKEVLTSQELKQKINDLLSKDEDQKVIVAADKICRFQDIVSVIDVLKGTGVKSLNIATRTEVPVF